MAPSGAQRVAISVCLSVLVISCLKNFQLFSQVCQRFVFGSNVSGLFKLSFSSALFALEDRWSLKYFVLSCSYFQYYQETAAERVEITWAGETRPHSDKTTTTSTPTTWSISQPKPPTTTLSRRWWRGGGGWGHYSQSLSVGFSQRVGWGPGDQRHYGEKSTIQLLVFVLLVQPLRPRDGQFSILGGRRKRFSMIGRNKSRDLNTRYWLRNGPNPFLLSGVWEGNHGDSQEDVWGCWGTLLQAKLLTTRPEILTAVCPGEGMPNVERQLPKS